MGIKIPTGEQYMWRAILKTDKIIDEFVYENDKFTQTDFNVIQNSDNLKTFSLVNENSEILFNEDGEFIIGVNGTTNKFNFIINESGTDNDLLEGIKNNLMMYRTAQQDWNGRTNITEYVFGYKTNTDVAYVKTKFYVNKDKVGFKFEITGKRSTNIDIKIIRDGICISDSKNIQIIRDKLINISL